MRNLIVYTVFVFAAVLSFTSCENEIEFSGDEKASMMVINGFVSPDSVVKVHVSRSKFFLKDDSSFDNITTADVSLWVNNEMYEDMHHIGNGFYSGTYVPKKGDIIKVVASTNAFPNVNCSAEIPGAIPVLSIDTVVKPINSFYNINYRYDPLTGTTVTDTIGVTRNMNMQVKISFHDSLNYENYYLLVVRNKKTYQSGDVRKYSTFFTSDDMVFGNSSAEENLLGETAYNKYFEFNDELIDGKTYNLTFDQSISSSEYKIVKPDGGDVGVNFVVKSEMIVELISITKSFYLYLKTVESGANVTDFFSEPVQIYSNINGGIGIFGGYNIATKSIEIPVTYESGGYYNSGDYGRY